MNLRRCEPGKAAAVLLIVVTCTLQRSVEDFSEEIAPFAFGNGWGKLDDEKMPALFAGIGGKDGADGVIGDSGIDRRRRFRHCIGDVLAAQMFAEGREKM